MPSVNCVDLFENIHKYFTCKKYQILHPKFASSSARELALRYMC